MLFEFIVFGAQASFWGYAIYEGFKRRDDEQSLEEQIQALPKPELSEQAELVVELLRSDSGWHSGYSSGGIFRTLTHDTGVRINESTISDTLSIAIQDDNGVYHDARLRSSDSAKIRAEVKAFETRRTDREQAALTRALAKRVVDRELHPVLGGAGVSRVPPSGDDGPTEHGSIPTGFLVYNAATQSLVKVVEGNPERISMSDEVAKRYNLPQKAHY